MASSTDRRVRVPCKAPGCSRLFTSKDNMLQHFGDSHYNRSGSSSIRQMPNPAQKLLACGECGAKFREYLDLHHHQISSPAHRKVLGLRDGSKYRCSVCSLSFVAPQDLDQHFLVKHAVQSMANEDTQRLRVAERFYRKWLHRGNAKIIDILRVYSPPHRAKRFEDYRQRLKLKSGNDERVRADGNTVQRFHGTTVRCGLGSDGQQQSLCIDPACNLCNIILAGFKTKKANVDGFLRFGKGIYVTATSSKANDYVKAYGGGGGGGGGESGRALLVCDVLAGLVFKVKKDMPQLDAPPEGYDSVCGEVGERLRYDELVVYDNAAILPKFIVVYELRQ